jgi:hypothetical protein
MKLTSESSGVPTSWYFHALPGSWIARFELGLTITCFALGHVLAPFPWSTAHPIKKFLLSPYLRSTNITLISNQVFATSVIKIYQHPETRFAQIPCHHSLGILFSLFSSTSLYTSYLL